MPTVRRWLILLTLGVMVSTLSSCALLNLLPTTTWKLNRGPALDEGQGYFSIPESPPADQSPRQPSPALQAPH